MFRVFISYAVLWRPCIFAVGRQSMEYLIVNCAIGVIQRTTQMMNVWIFVQRVFKRKCRTCQNSEIPLCFFWVAPGTGVTAFAASLCVKQNVLNCLLDWQSWGALKSVHQKANMLLQYRVFLDVTDWNGWIPDNYAVSHAMNSLSHKPNVLHTLLTDI